MATKQQKLHSKALKHFRELEAIIDAMKAAGPCDLDEDNALLNTRHWLHQLAGRCNAVWLSEG